MLAQGNTIFSVGEAGYAHIWHIETSNVHIQLRSQHFGSVIFMPVVYPCKVWQPRLMPAWLFFEEDPAAVLHIKPGTHPKIESG